MKKAMTVGQGLSATGQRVHSTTMPSQKEDLEDGMKILAARVISFNDYHKDHPIKKISTNLKS